MSTDYSREALHYFAELLDYPGPNLLEIGRDCAELLDGDEVEAAERLRDFVQFVEVESPGRMEEIYTGTFDVNPACFIFVGYLLFGEGFKRGKFLVRLKEKYREHGFSAGKELADHMAVMIRFLAELDRDDELSRQITNDCLLPAMGQMIEGLDQDTDRPNPYSQVLLAAMTVLEGIHPPVPAM